LPDFFLSGRSSWLTFQPVTRGGALPLHGNHTDVHQFSQCPFQLGTSDLRADAGTNLAYHRETSKQIHLSFVGDRKHANDHPWIWCDLMKLLRCAEKEV
jgi:hypothetical protein